MLSQVVVAAYEKPISNGYHIGQLTVTGVSPCSYATYLNYHHLDDQEFDAEARMRMKNGKWQEQEVLEDLLNAGFRLKYTGSNQMMVHVGRSRVAGRPDGLIEVSSIVDLLEIKAMNLSMHTTLKEKGIDAFPGYKCQVQLYLVSEELRDKVSGCWFYTKHKDSCVPFDFFIERDKAYSKPIIEAVDEIILGKVEVSPPTTCPIPSYCRHQGFCKRQELLDLSKVSSLTKPEVIRMWLEGQFHLTVGKQLNEESRVLLQEYLGDLDALFVEDQTTLLEVKKIIQHRWDFNKTKFVDLYGAAALVGVMEENIVTQMRVYKKD